eukprot:CAMPEP_0176467180 /NCGR_PEP_ID=MMETSP0127-20121128/38316_1 /TAXON_ID=938130 /ORGANISM="Platyophrya macrostoma, Strain WH" /LENGTH=316 /DNA_ID=CAMNT_0017860453 /DNA_START=40 /DNA_END=991 /DNA_ORIENTATION=+
MAVWQAALIIALTCSFIIALFLIGFSVRLVDATDHAIKVNKNVMAIYTDEIGHTSVQTTVNSSGDSNATTTTTTAISPQFTEEATYQNGITARTSEGLLITIDAAVFYKIGTTDSPGQKAAQILDIYAKFGDNYEFPVIALTEGLIQDVASRYQAYQFFTNRQEVQDAMETELRTNMNDLGFALACLDMDILNLNFDPSFQQAVEQAQIVVENTLTEQANYDTIQVQAATRVAAASIDAEIIILNAQTNSNITYLNKQATQTASLKIAGLGALSGYLGFSESEILDFLWIYYQIYYPSSANLNMGIIKPGALKSYP